VSNREPTNVSFAIIAVLIIVGMLWVAFVLLRPSQIEKAGSPHSAKTFRNTELGLSIAKHGHIGWLAATALSSLGV